MLKQIDSKKEAKTYENGSNNEVIILSALVPFQIAHVAEKNIQFGNSVKSEKLKDYLKEINTEIEKEWIEKLSELKSNINKKGSWLQRNY